MKSSSFLATAFLMLAVSFASAQEIKYVSYFPVPYASHEKIHINNLSILGSRGGAQITVGSNSNITGVLNVQSGFATAGNAYIASQQNTNPLISESPVNLTVGVSTEVGSNPEYDSSLSTMSNIQITSFGGSSLRTLEAFNNAVITGFRWGSNGGIGLNGSGNVNWPGECAGKNLNWVQLKIQGSDHYKTYLSCGGASGTSGGGCTCGGTAPGNYASCGDGRSKLCLSDCTWSACSCPSPYTWNGTSCMQQGSNITPVVKTADAAVTCGNSSCNQYSYAVCQDGTGRSGFPTGYNPASCRERTTQSVCYNDFLRGVTEAFECTEISMPACPTGSSNADLCIAKGAGYKCFISGTGSAIIGEACMCEWYDGGRGSGSYCDEASGLSCTRASFAGEGTATYLSCQ